jgi:hypothetical protein
MVMHAEEADHKGKPVFGVEGVTSLYSIPNFDLVRGLVPEIMHGLFLGVNQQLFFGRKLEHLYIRKCRRKLDFVLKDLSAR